MADKKARGCFHCHEPVPKGFSQTLEYDGSSRYFCCLGCFSIAETIIDNGLDDYYKFRTSVAPKADEIIPEELKSFDDKELIDHLAIEQTEDSSSIELLCENLKCSACSWLIEKQISALNGVNKVSANIAEQTILVKWQEDKLKLSQILEQCYLLGYPVKPYRSETAEKLNKQQDKLWLKRLGLAGLGMMQVMMYAVALYIGAFDGIDSLQRSFLRWVSFCVATPVLLYAGYPFFQSAWRAIKVKQLNMDVPISLALALAYLSSLWATLSNSGEVYFDSVTMFIFFLLIGRYLEYRARQKVRQAFYQKNFNSQLLVSRIDNDGDITRVPIQKIAIGDTLLVKPGETIAADAVLISGTASINEAMLSGEYLPVNKAKGEQLLAASINGDHAILIQVTHSAENSFLDKLKQMQRNALLEKPRVTLVADKVARYFVAAILCIASFTFIGWWFYQAENALWITIAVLVVSCPCALSLATPVALTCGVSALNKANILVQEENFLQKLEATTDIVFDKTGTLTTGTLSVASIENFSNKQEDEVLGIVAAMEKSSEHPIAKAFSQYVDNQYKSSDIKLHPYAGVEANVNDNNYWFGNLNFLQAQLPYPLSVSDESLLYLANDTEIIASIRLQDTLRASAKEAAQELSKLGINLHLLSGDPSHQVQHLAKELNMTHWQNNLKPLQKLEYLHKLRLEPSRKILAVGDGLNDAPIMAASDTSIAMSGASDFTKANANAYLLSANLEDISLAIIKSKQTNKVIKQNLIWAIGYNLIVLPFAILGMIPPYLAALGMSLSSLVVVINSLRLNPKT